MNLRLAMLSVLYCAAVSIAAAQSGPSADYQPAMGGWVYNGTNYVPITTTGTAGQAADYQPAIGLWGYNATTKKWYPCGSSNSCGFGGSSSSGVTSYNSRTGAVTPQSGDYTASQVGAAPATNPTGGQGNYAPIASPTFTGVATSPTYTLSDPNGDPISATLSTPSSGFTRETLQAAVNNAFHLAVFGGDYSGLEWGNSSSRLGQWLYIGGSVLFAVDGQLVLSATASGPAMWNRPLNTSLFEANEGAAIASAATIAPSSSLFHITGTTTIATMTPPSGMSTSVATGGIGGCLNFITDAAVSFSAGTAVGSFKNGFTSTAGTMYQACLTPSTGLWYAK